MVKSSLYTRTGDKGHTSLVGGTRVPKYSLRLEAYGTIDEFSAFLGFLAAAPVSDNEIQTQLRIIGNKLFNIGAYLATLPSAHQGEEIAGLSESDVVLLETWIDNWDAKLPPLNNFVLPGGCEEAARCGLARTVCRRAERRILELESQEYVSPILLAYMNRLSDYLFVIGRYLNHINGEKEINWEK